MQTRPFVCAKEPGGTHTASCRDYERGAGEGGGERAQWLRAYLVLAEDLGPILRTCIGPHDLWDLTPSSGISHYWEPGNLFMGSGCQGPAGVRNPCLYNLLNLWNGEI